MLYRILAVCVSVLVVGACRESSTRPDSPIAPAAPSSLRSQSVERPWKAQVNWTVKEVQWAGVPGQTKSLFGGRCSVPSDYIVRATFEGEATHTGRITGETEHCTQITWSPQGPVAVTYGDGIASFRSAEGSGLSTRYGNGVVVMGASESSFTDTFTITGGTGLFAGATGGGEEGGRFTDFNAILAGAPVPMWMNGTITYRPGREM